MSSLVGIADLATEDVDAILAAAKTYQADPNGHQPLAGKIIAMAFFEPSTRTRLSFEAAAIRLGAHVIGFSDATNTSSAKGETLEDTIRVLAGYADAIVLRHPEKGAAARAAAVAGIPVINAGDGAGEHPTQTLLDLYTIKGALGDLSGKKVAVVGDLKYGRTVHSLVPALLAREASVIQVPVGGLTLPEELGAISIASLEEATATCDVVYMTRVQKERLSEDVSAGLVLTASLMENSKAIVLHPLPRTDEIEAAVDDLPAAKYFEQARNGVPVRMAVLAHLLGE